MTAFEVQVILLDIEGTVSPLAYVHEVMFPYVRTHAATFLVRRWQDDAVRAALEQMARDEGTANVAAWCANGSDVCGFVVAEIERLMAADAKKTGLKVLQGLMWEEAFQSGQLRSELFADVEPALREWTRAGRTLCLYSSGSVHAQKLFFANTSDGDLTALFTGYYDTVSGSKREAASYRTIASAEGVATSAVLFISDLVAELDAAREAGMNTALAIRPGNPTASANDHPTISSLNDLHIP